MSLERRPITLRAANTFVVEHHRHAGDVRGWLFGCGLYLGDELRAVGIASRPVARQLDDGMTIEVARVCTLDDRYACSMLYGALCRAAKALGYQRAVTYTLATEAGTSPAAAGFTPDSAVTPEDSWARAERHRYDCDLFGNPQRDPGPKRRWVRTLT